MTGDVQYRLTRLRLLRPAVLGMAFILSCVIPAAGQYPAASSGASQSGALFGKRSEWSSQRTDFGPYATRCHHSRSPLQLGDD